MNRKAVLMRQIERAEANREIKLFQYLDKIVSDVKDRLIMAGRRDDGKSIDRECCDKAGNE